MKCLLKIAHYGGISCIFFLNNRFFIFSANRKIEVKRGKECERKRGQRRRRKRRKKKKKEEGE
jgi:hypothetical protein